MPDDRTDRVEMALDQVIEKDWKPGKAKGATKGAKGPKSKGAAKGAKGRDKGKGQGRGLVRRNPVMNKARRQGKGEGRTMKWVPKGQAQAARAEREQRPAKGKGRGQARKGAGRGGGGGGVAGRPRLWRGAQSANSEWRSGKGGKGKSKGKGKGFGWDPRRVNRLCDTFQTMRKGQSKGKATKSKGGGKGQALAVFGGGKSYGKSKGNSWSGAGNWGSSERQERRDSWDGYSGGGSWGSEMPAAERLSAEDKRMMKKITIVAQLDKVPKPHPAMQHLRGRRSSGETGALSSRFAANYRR
ncbi:unnamed protein product [Effrenium voratum]|nr:unnamed protein product [Effrenium voratum]